MLDFIFSYFKFKNGIYLLTTTALRYLYITFLTLWFFSEMHQNNNDYYNRAFVVVNKASVFLTF